MLKKSLIKIFRKHERGQAIIIVAFAMVGLIAMAGLVTDTGIMLIEYGKLKRAVDAAAIAAAQQYSLPKAQLTEQKFEDAAINFLNLNETRQITELTVHSCFATGPDRPALCNPIGGPSKDNRKLVEITAKATVNFGFLSIIGIRSTTITTTALGEAATLDVVLVIDTSASMAYETRPASQGGPYGIKGYDFDVSGLVSENPQTCNGNPTNPCQPLEAVKDAAKSFASTLSFDYDRLSIVTLTGQATSNASRDPVVALSLTSDETAVTTAIDNLRVFTPRVCDNSATFATVADGACIHLTNPADPTTFQLVKCPYFELRFQSLDGFYPRYPGCPSSNVGGALKLAGSVLTGADKRLDSFWVVLVLLAGPANSTSAGTGYPLGYCPINEFYPAGITDVNDYTPYPYKPCTDGLPLVRHSASATMNFSYKGTTFNNTSIYDPDDYAMDQADALATLLSGEGVTIYTIGLGSEVTSTAKQVDTSIPMAQHLLQYIALEAGDATSPNINHGQYFPAPVFQDLENIFKAIAANIATKISQ